MPHSYIPARGDNIFDIGGYCGRVLRASGYDRAKIDAIHREARQGDYDHALEVYGRFIRIRGK